ncbi:MAG: restriction endonuclease subunit S [Campylobacteraceae bacterium]|nr:restriction endonuclease subunit S [Campylobacteraceae bacterium]
MEGLEASEVRLSELNLGDRCDAEYFSKQDLEIEIILKRTSARELRSFGNFVASAFYPAATQLYEFGDIPFVRCVDCINFPLITTKQEYFFEKIPKTFINANKGINILKKGDIVITKVGTPCYTSLIFDYDTVALSRTVLGMKDIEGINPFYLLVFLRSKYGFSQLLRERELTIQYQLTLERVKKILVYIPSLEFQNSIQVIVEKYIKVLNNSKSLYREAEALLLETIGLKDFQPSRENKNIKTFKESFLATGRLDAEYYQPKYEEIIAKIKQKEYDLLCNLVYIKKSIEPGSDTYSDKGLPFLRVADYNKLGISAPEKKLSDNFCNDNRVLIDGLRPKKDTILFSKDGSVGTAYMLSEDADFITSGAILHLTVKNRKVLPEYLTLALNSEAIRQQAERDAGGSIILHWRMEEIEHVIVPLIDISVQRQIAELINKSFALRKESEQLLEEAKNMVEKEIEQNAIDASQ